MHRIHALSDELIRQIAAGEVIERPASALKELVENSIDAGATQIAVELEEGGLKKIRVVDNGCGMHSEDAALAFERHATSKIATLDDLFHLHSLGFRGEALASIAGIAQVILLTRSAEERVGTRIEVEGGRVLSNEEAAAPVGTDLMVLGLFKHTPARKKYMKSEATEYGHCFEILAQLSLANPDIAFRLLRDGEVILELPQGQSLQERVHTLYGGQTAQALIPVQYHQSNLIIQGFVGKPELSRSSRKYQFLFVNGHPIDNRSVSHAVQEAFHSLLMTAKYPWFVLLLELDPALVDVNVHPRKLEVRFVNQQEVYRAVFGAVQHALNHAVLNPVLTAPASPATSPLELAFVSASPITTVQAPLDWSPSPAVSSSQEESLTPVLALKPLAQVARSYIVAESEEGLVLIDQHAAHERIRYARLLKAMEESKPLRQALLTPLQLDLGVESLTLLREHATLFTDLGFELEAFGGSTHLLRSVPSGLEHKNPERIFQEILSTLQQERRSNAVHDFREALLTVTACRGAIKFGDPLTLLEMEALVRDMLQTPHYTHCPHGRPSILTFTHDKLETLFKRKNF